EGVLKHVTGEPRVFAKDDLRTRAFRKRARIQLRENVSGRPAQLERGLRCDRFDVSDTADAVGPENLCRLVHGLTETRNSQTRKCSLGRLCRWMFVVVITQENAFVVQPDRDRVPFKWKSFQNLAALNDRRPVLVFASDDVAQFVISATDRRKVKAICAWSIPCEVERPRNW